MSDKTFRVEYQERVFPNQDIWNNMVTGALITKRQSAINFVEALKDMSPDKFRNFKLITIEGL